MARVKAQVSLIRVLYHTVQDQGLKLMSLDSLLKCGKKENNIYTYSFLKI